jgi:CDP-diacylglycerol--serine O-phosphatidyltransferase
MKKIYLLPNLVTTLGMFCGFFSVVMTTKGEFTLAAWAVIAAIVFDNLDGRIARLARATSSFGVEYDSLSDLISFGMAPAMLLYKWSLESYDRLGWLAAFLYMVCAALRLARFNVSTNKYRNYFQGLPSPAAAGLVASFVIFIAWAGGMPEMMVDKVGLFLAVGMAVLMVSSIAFPSFKELNWRSKSTPGLLLVGVLVIVFVAIRPEVTLFVVGFSYVVLSLAWYLGCWLIGTRHGP